MDKKYGEGLHHICYEVDNIDKALDHAQKHNAKLRICEACNVYGSHAHPEGFVAFLDDEGLEQKSNLCRSTQKKN